MARSSKTAIVVVLLFVSTSALATEYPCPEGCSCKGSAADDAVSSLRVRCDAVDPFDSIDFGEIAQHVTHLNLSGNNIASPYRTTKFPRLQKLDLSGNKIKEIDADSFSDLTSLARLDLTNNMIGHISKDAFVGLNKLERLFLGQNNIATIPEDTFVDLPNFNQLDLSGNPIRCDCEIAWIGNWSRNLNIKLIGKCASPDASKGQTLKKLRADSVKCESADARSNALMLRPQHDQVVFEGDSLVLKCKAPFSTIKTNYSLSWIFPNTADNSSDINITNSDVLTDGMAESDLRISKLSNEHSGIYTCIYSRFNSTDLLENITLIVISNETKYCHMTVTSDNKGLYTWPRSIRGHLVSQPCYNKEGALAYYNCSDDGNWTYLNTSACPYASETTKMLEQFALLNFSVFKGNEILISCQRLYTLLLKNTPPVSILDDPVDIYFIVSAITNYLRYADKEKGLGSVLLQIINSVMSLPQSVLMTAENMHNSCSSIISIVEELSQYITNIDGHKNSLAIERFSIKRDSFTGLTCIWYSMPDLPGQIENESTRMLHCSTVNDRNISPLLSERDKVIEASIQIPKTLFFRMENGIGGLQRPYNLIVAMYEKSSFFTKLPPIKNVTVSNFGTDEKNRGRNGKPEEYKQTKWTITTPVVGVKLANITLLNPLAEPIYIMVRDSALALGVDARAVLWDEENRVWSDSPDGCSILHIINNLIVIQCHKLGYVGLMKRVETSIYGGRSGGARFKFSHPAIYIGSTVLLACLLASILTYILCYSEIHMTVRTRHSLVNTWLALGLLCFMYTLGIYQTEDVRLCQAIGLLIHYLTLSCLLWITVTVIQLYKNLSKNQSQPLQSPDDELPSEVPIQKPILGIYLVGWGIALIVCGISGAVNMKDYASYSHCFLSNAPALSAVFVPAIIIVIFISILFLLIRCTIRSVNGQLSEGTQATENVDLEMWEPSLLVNNTVDRRSEHSQVDSEVEDTEHTPIVQFRAHVIVLVVYILTWGCGTIAVHYPFPFYMPYHEDVFSILYAVFAVILGVFILFFYGIARSDVRSQWLLMRCYLKKSKKCCRTRSVFDANAQTVTTNHVLTPIPNAVAAQNRSRSSSQNSNRTNSKSNNSNILKAAAEFNSHTLPESVSSGNKISNVNLVVLHRQQYRSNNSVITFPESGSNCVEMFYNPNQSNVARKFFKKQRKNVRRNCLDLPRRHNFDTDSQISSAPLPSIDNLDSVSNILSSSSKVNNTNIHVEKGQLSDNGMKESRNQLNPNILSDNEDMSDKPQLKQYIIDKEPLKQHKLADFKASNQNPIIMNIYTNIPETKVPQHQVVSSVHLKNSEHDKKIAPSISTDEFKGSIENLPTMRTVSQQCSLEYSSTSEVATPLNQLGSDKTLNTHSELTSLQETHSALCSAIASDTDDTPSFAKYADYKKPKTIENSKKHTSCSKLQQNTDGAKFEKRSVNKSLQEICSRSESELNHDENNDEANNAGGEMDRLLRKDVSKSEKSEQCEAGNSNVHEHMFENESDIYFSNYQMSEVSIRSHGSYAPPSKLCVNDIGLDFSNSELSHNQHDDDCYENQYVNYNPTWKKRSYDNRFYRSPAVSCPDVNRCDNDSPNSLVSEIDELYKQITIKDKRSKKYPYTAHGSRHHHQNERLMRHCESDSCISESHSDILDQDQKAETRV